MCGPTEHVFAPLYPGWEPHLDTPCDCGLESWKHHMLVGFRKALGRAGIGNRCVHEPKTKTSKIGM